MKEPITIDQFTNFLNSTFPDGLACPLCRRQDWEVREENGRVDVVQTPEPLNIAEIDEWFDKGLPDERYDSLAHPKEKIAGESIAIRCAHCGYLAHFDKLFVEEKVHEQTK